MIGFGVQSSEGYLEGQGDLVSIVITLITHIVTLINPPIIPYLFIPLNLDIHPGS